MGKVLLTINGGSSSVKFAVYRTANPPVRLFGGQIERIGESGTELIVPEAGGVAGERRPFNASDHNQAAEQLVGWLRRRLGDAEIAGIGHRVVHGGPSLLEHQLATA